MNPTITQEINLFRDFLDQQDDFGIVIGAHQNFDTVACALSLFLSLSQAGKKVQIISKKAPIVEVSSLVGVDKIRENFQGATGKLIVSLPYIKGEVEKVLFTEAPNTINFHLTAATGRSITPFDVNDVKLNWEGGAPQAIIAIGAGSVDELAGVIDANSTKVVNIDNYQGNTRFGDVVLVDEGFSSLTEISGKIIKDLSLPMDVDIAQNIMDGVLNATRNFTKNNTSPLAFEAVSSAMYKGAQRKVEEQQQQPRREQGFSNPSRQPQQQQERFGRDQRQQGRPQPRVSENDFPAMHMQQPRNPQNQGQVNENRRMNNPTRNVSSNPVRSNQQFGQNRNVSDVRNKISEEVKPQPQFQPQNEDIHEAEVVEDIQMNQPIDDVQMPEENFTPQNPEEIPDDWLMPKVFKGSKNNN